MRSRSAPSLRRGWCWLTSATTWADSWARYVLVPRAHVSGWAGVTSCTSCRLRQVLPVYVERLRSESTRLAAIKALIVMSASPHALDMSPILHDVMSELHSLLRYVRVAWRSEVRKRDPNERHVCGQATLARLAAVNVGAAHLLDQATVQPVHRGTTRACAGRGCIHGQRRGPAAVQPGAWLLHGSRAVPLCGS